MSGPYGVVASLDTLLGLATQLAWLVFAIYVVSTFFTTLRRQGIRYASLRLLSSRVLWPLLLVVGISLLSAALVFVYPHQGAVVVSLLSPGGIRSQPLRAGLHWIFPLLEHGVRYPISWQTYTMSQTPEEGAKLGNDSIRARTSDGQEVRLSCSVIFRLDFAQLVAVHIDWQDRYTEDLVRPVIRSVVRTQVSQFTVRQVNSSARQELEATLDNLLRQALEGKGLLLDRFLLRDVTFTTEYAEAVELKQVALEGEEAKAHEAQQLRNLAAGRADAIKVEAQAQAEAVKVIAEALKHNPAVLTYRYIDKLSPNIRVMLVPTNTPLILPLPQLEERDGAEAQELVLPSMPTPSTPVP